jgi:hypothetical protein
VATQFKQTEKFLKTYGKDVEKEIKTRLRGNGKFASGKLYKSIRSEVKEEKAKFILSFYMEDYGKYVDKGVEGAKSKKAGDGGKSIYKFKNKMPPEKPFKSWLKRKGIDKSASFAIRRSIYLFGITPTNFFTIPTTRRKKQFENELKRVMAKDVNKIVQDEINKR